MNTILFFIVDELVISLSDFVLEILGGNDTCQCFIHNFFAALVHEIIQHKAGDELGSDRVWNW